MSAEITMEKELVRKTVFWVVTGLVNGAMFLGGWTVRTTFINNTQIERMREDIGTIKTQVSTLTTIAEKKWGKMK